jgi:hypothetical protein
VSNHAYLLLIFASIFTVGAGTGFLLKRRGKPYPVLLLTLHKLLLLGAGVALVVLLIRKNQDTPLNSSDRFFFVAIFLSFILMIVSGGLVSIEKPMPNFIQLLHKVFPYITILLSILLIFLVL